jgi:nucleoside-diphosphate-sugar epimerase
VNSATNTLEHFHGRQVLVMGGGGFIGANLSRRLLTLGAQVHLLMRPNAADWRIREILTKIRIHKGDITDEPSLAQVFDKVQPDFVFHLATPRGNDASAWKRMIEVNFLGAMRLMDQMLRIPSARLVVTGSSLEYGPRTQPHSEQDTLIPVTWHGVGKAAAGLVYLQATRSMGLRINQLRLFHVYGPWESSHRLLPSAVRSALAGCLLPLTGAEIRRDWVYVEDVVDALLCVALSESQGEIYNIGSGTELSNEEVVSIVERLTETRLARTPGVFPEGPSDTAHRCADINKARIRLGWIPQYDITNGISATLAWHRGNPLSWESETGGKPLHV